MTTEAGLPNMVKGGILRFLAAILQQRAEASDSGSVSLLEAERPVPTVSSECADSAGGRLAATPLGLSHNKMFISGGYPGESRRT